MDNRHRPSWAVVRMSNDASRTKRFSTRIITGKDGTSDLCGLLERLGSAAGSLSPTARLQTLACSSS